MQSKQERIASKIRSLESKVNLGQHASTDRLYRLEMRLADVEKANEKLADEVADLKTRLSLADLKTRLADTEHKLMV